MKVSLFFRWYDLWVGAYWDRKKQELYVCPFPMVGLKFSFEKIVLDDLVCPYCGSDMRRQPSYVIWICTRCDTSWDDMATWNAPGCHLGSPYGPVFFEKKPARKHQ